MNRAAVSAVLIWGGALLPAAGLTAQAPNDRAALTRLRDSIATVADTAALLALESRWIDRARIERDDPVHHLRLGVIALRLSELSTGRHLDNAIAEFEWAAELAPGWPWPWYGRGLAEARAEDRAGGFAGGLWVMLGLDRERLAGNAFARAVEADPMFTRALEEFARIALEQRIDAPTAAALRALRSATSSPIGWDATLLLLRGRLERLTGSPDSARIAFERAALLGFQPDLAHLELARTLPLVTTGGRLSVMEAYLFGAQSNDPEVIANYRRDLEPIARTDQLAAFDSVPAVARRAWLEQFWQQLAALDLRTDEERLAEHFRRWHQARQDFRLPPFRRRYRFGLEIYRSGETELDDRGVIWIRHGPPNQRIQWPRAEYVRPPEKRNYGNESWRYDRPEGPMVLHFVAHDDPQDYRVVETPLALDVPLHLLEARAHELPGLDRLIRAGEYTIDWVREEVRLQGRASVRIATGSTAMERQYDGILTGRSQWLAAGERGGRPLAHLVYAVSADSLRALARATGQTTLQLRVRATLLGRDGRVVAVVDTHQVFPIPSDAARLVAARVEVPVTPGLLRIRYGIEAAPGLGVVYPVDSIVAPRVRGRRPELSALLIGREGRSLSWAATPSDTAWIDAGGAYSPSDTMVVYAEAYGLSAGSDVSVELVLTRRRSGLAKLFGGRGEAIALRERLSAPAGGVLRIKRGMALGGVEPGIYQLELIITAAGERITRRRGLTITR